jgi:hypothetical protein
MIHFIFIDMKYLLILFIFLGFASCNLSFGEVSDLETKFATFNKNDDKDDDPDDGNAGEPKKRDHKGRKHRGAE